MPLTSTGSPRYGPRYRGSARGPSYRRERRGPRRGLVLSVVALVLLAAVGGGGYLYLQARQRDRDRETARLQAEATRVATTYLSAWSAGDAAAAAGQVVPAQRGAAQALLAKTRTDLHAVTTAYTPSGPVTSTGADAGVAYDAKVTVRGLGDEQWSGRVPLVREGTSWAVAFAPPVVHPGLVPGGRFAYSRTVPTRGKVLLADGTSMALAQAGQLASTVRGTVETLKDDAAVKRAGPSFVRGDDAGTSGLQAAFNPRLQGTPGGSLRLLDAAGKQVGAPLLAVMKADGKDVKTTFRGDAQRAAETALSGVRFPLRSMVAVDARTGALLAVVNPSLGLAGTYAPGSTFKVVTTVAALSNGVGAQTTLDCSPTATVNGRTVKNAEGESFGPLSFPTAFAKSCNTWFARLPGAIGGGGKGIEAMTRTAELFGFTTGGPSGDPKAAQTGARGVLPAPLASFGGSFPKPKDGAQAAGQSFGQDLVLASPMQMASVAAAVASGTWHQPRVTLDTKDVAHPLPAGTAETVRGFMAGVVAPGGTAGSVGFPGGVVGKTGTAEVQGKKDNSWFIGIRGSVAVACEVDGGGFGADVAAPAVSRFFGAYGG